MASQISKPWETIGKDLLQLQQLIIPVVFFVSLVYTVTDISERYIICVKILQIIRN